MTENARVKIHGIFRSGTNLAKYLILDQFKCSVTFNESGHKHLPLPFLPPSASLPNTPIVVCTKDPFANLVSLYRYAESVKFLHFDCGKSWDEFLTQRFIIRMNGDTTQAAHRFNSPVDYWNSFYFNALSLPDSRRILFRYEDILKDPEIAIRSIEEKFPHLERTGNPLNLPDSVMAKSKDGEGIEDLATGAKFSATPYYTAREYLNEFNEKQLDWVMQTLDSQVAEWTGYEAFDSLGTGK